MRNRLSLWGPRPGDFPLGSLESRAAARAVELVREVEARDRVTAQLQNLTPDEQLFCAGSDDPEVQARMVWYARHTIIPKCRLFRFPLPSTDVIRRLAKAFEESKSKRHPFLNDAECSADENGVPELESSTSQAAG